MRIKLTYAIAVSWLVFGVLNLAFTGTWWWNITMIVPPFMFLLASLIVLIIAASTRKLRLIVLGVIAMVLWFPFVKFDLPEMVAPDASVQNTKLIVWNTQAWQNDDLQDEFHKILTDGQADIYLLQEVFNEELEFLDVTAEIQRILPGFHIAFKDDLLTISRFPITNIAMGTGYGPWGGFLRTDLQIGNENVSVYNIHIPVPLQPAKLIGGNGFAEMRILHDQRQRMFGELATDLQKTEQRILIAGDFNSTWLETSMHKLVASKNLHQISKSGFIPSTFTLGPLKLWRIDWVLASSGIQARDYGQQTHLQISDHDLLQMNLVL